MAEKLPVIKTAYRDLDGATSMPKVWSDYKGVLHEVHFSSTPEIDPAEIADEQSSDTEVLRVRSSSGGEIVYPKGFKRKSPRTPETVPTEVGDGPEPQDSTTPERGPMTPEESAMLQLVEARKAYARDQAKDRQKVWGDRKAHV